MRVRGSPVVGLFRDYFEELLNREIRAGKIL